jgi:hypothetical protein
MFRLNGQERSVPNLVIARRVIDKMTAAARGSIEDETGEAMVGLVVPSPIAGGIPTLYVLDTISPDESAIRQFHTFQQGDDRQDELIWWLQENWRETRAKRHQGSKWDVPLRYLGDWHKQPGSMIQPSGGDLMTAINWIDDPDNHMDFLLAPIVTVGHTHTTGTSSALTNYLMVPQPDGTALRVDFWYIDRKARLFLPVTPALYPNDQLPTLVEYPWHLVNEQRFSGEMRVLEDDGLLITLVLWDADGTTPLEICFLTARVGADKMIILITDVNFPYRPPIARIAPFVQMQPDDDMYDVFARAWEASDAIEYQPEWTTESTLVEYVHALEAHLGLTKPESTESSEETL